MKLLFDIHCHTMTLARPAIGRYMDAFLKGGFESLYSQVVYSGRLLPELALKGGEYGRNMLAVMENDPASMIAMMEDDLSGAYPVDGVVRDGIIGETGLSLLGEQWDAWLVCPLMMDFGARAVGTDVYYSTPPRKSVEEAVRETLSGVSGYRRARPDGKIVVRPFLGIDPGARGAAATERTLSRYFAGFSRHKAAGLSSFRAAGRWKGDPLRPLRASFAGVKLYPPLGFDPWPGDRAALDATVLLYRFCERRRIPIVVHCDDQGYRTIPFAELARLTAPERWEPVLEAFPELIVDFAHFGEQYLAHGTAKGGWTREIIALMLRYPGVYADVAFNGCDPAYWQRLHRLLENLDVPTADIVRKRLLFGSDFVVSLVRSRSYLDYVCEFADSPLDLGLKRAMMGGNPEHFLFEG
jgi:hypothetical protein